MRPTSARLAGGGPDPKSNKWMGWWGELGGPTQRGVTTYALSPNRLNPFSGVLHAAIFNTWRRSKNQVGYWLPPFAIAYLAMDWAIKRNEYLNSKPGRMETARLEKEAEEREAAKNKK